MVNLLSSFIGSLKYGKSVVVMLVVLLKLIIPIIFNLMAVLVIINNQGPTEFKHKSLTAKMEQIISILK